MRNPDAFDAFYKDARDRCCCRRTRSPATSPPPGPRCATPSSSPGTTGARSRDSTTPSRGPARTRGRTRSAGTPPACGTARRASTPRTAHARRARPAHAHPAQDAAAHPADHALDRRHGPRGRAPGARGGARAPDRDRPVRAPPRRPDHQRSARCSSRCGRTSRPVRWPRPTILRRAGAARRRTHTTVGAVAAVAALGLTGSLVTDAAGVRPTLDRETVAAGAGPPRRAARGARAPAGHAAAERDARAAQVDGAPSTAAAGAVRHHRQHQRRRAGPALPAGAVRRPRGTAALVRTFTPRPRAGSRSLRRRRPSHAAGSAVSSPRRPRSPAARRAAERTFDTTAGWYAGCTDRRVQLLSTQRVDRVGDEAVQLVLRAWDAPVTTMVVGVARTGPTTTTTTRHPGARRAARSAAPAPGCSPPPSPPVRPAGRRRLRPGAPGSGRSPRCPWARCRHALRGRPAAGPGRGPALGRHRAAPGVPATWRPPAATAPTSRPPR